MCCKVSDPKISNLVVFFRVSDCTGEEKLKLARLLVYLKQCRQLEKREREEEEAQEEEEEEEGSTSRRRRRRLVVVVVVVVVAAAALVAVLAGVLAGLAVASVGDLVGSSAATRPIGWEAGYGRRDGGGSEEEEGEEGDGAGVAARALVKRLIAGEAPDQPLDDAALTDALAQRGIRLARRTVAKYRELLKIPPTTLRKAL